MRTMQVGLFTPLARRTDPTTSHAAEEWRPVPGYEGRYEVSDHGRVRSLWFANGKVSRPRQTPLIMGYGSHQFGYSSVHVGKGGVHETLSLHRLVCTVFHGPCPEGHLCGHRDGNPRNNHASNLRWITRQENEDDKRIHGTMGWGERQHLSKLTADKVREIRRRSLAGETGEALAREFGISKSSMSAVILGKTWKHIEMPLPVAAERRSA